MTSDIKKFSRVLPPFTKRINQNKTDHFTIRLFAPKNTPDGIASAVTVTGE